MSEPISIPQLLEQYGLVVVECLMVLDENWQLGAVNELERLARGLQTVFLQPGYLPWNLIAPISQVQPARFAVQGLITACQEYRACKGGRRTTGKGWIEYTRGVKLAITELQPYVDLVSDGLRVPTEGDIAGLLAQFRVEENLVTRWQLAGRLRRLAIQAEGDATDLASQVRKVKFTDMYELADATNRADRFAGNVADRSRECRRLLDEFMRGVETILRIRGQSAAENDADRELDLNGWHANVSIEIEGALLFLLKVLGERTQFKFLKSVKLPGAASLAVRVRRPPMGPSACYAATL